MLRDILVISQLIFFINLCAQLGVMNTNVNNSSSQNNITKCDRARCVCCKSNRICLDSTYCNFVTGEVVQLPLDFKATCTTKNCIYLIKCKKPNCQYQYIGHTVNRLCARISNHKSSILRGKVCKLVRKHFTGVHNTEDMMIMPIAVFSNNLTLKQREEIEEEYILKLNTLFPYGLNARCKKAKVLDSETDVLTSKCTIYSKFPSVNISRNNRGGNQANNNSQFDVDGFFDSIFEDNLVRFRNIRTRLNTLKKQQLKNVYLKSINLYSQTKFDNLRNYHLTLYIKDLSWFYLVRMEKSRNVKPKPSNFIIFTYVNKYMEQIKFPKIFAINDIVSKFPHRSKSGYFSSPSVSFRYEKTIRSKVLNYNKVLRENLDPTVMTCDCTNHPFFDSHHKHVITGNLDIVQCKDLKSLLSKGLNYRDQSPPNKKSVLAAVKEGLTEYIKKTSAKSKLPEVMYNEWKLAILDYVRSKVAKFSKYNFNNILSQQHVKDELAALHDKYVLVPTDKAANNVTFMCKKLYLTLITNEMNSTTFQAVFESEKDIVKKHESFLDKFGLKLEDDNSKLPTLYITPKQHKNPIGFRFITAGYNCSLQQLSKQLSICLKSMLHSAKNHSQYQNKFHTRNDFYIIDNNVPVLDFIASNNIQDGHKSISTFDFSTLYTSIPHQQLKDNLCKFVNKVFEFKNKTFIIPNSFNKRAYFSDGISSNKLAFSKDDLIECLTYLIDNSFVNINGAIYRQIIGIPMGTNSAPQIANIYLHVYEYLYISNLIELGDDESLEKLTNIFRYQDDLISFNDLGLLESVLQDIYPQEMIVNKTNISPCKCNYLDMTISIYRGKFVVKLFDKRKDYKFDVISYPF